MVILLALLYFAIVGESGAVFYEDSIPRAPPTFATAVHRKQTSAGKPRVYESISEIGNPSSVHLYHDFIFISLFKDNKVLIGNLINKTMAGFADDSYCTRNRFGTTVCGIVEGPWSMQTFNTTLYVSCFGSDQILLFSLRQENFGWFIDAFGDSEHLDCPEGIAIDAQNELMYIANYCSSSVVLFDLKTHRYLRDFVTHSSTFGYLMGPETVVLDVGMKMLAVASYGNNSVLFFALETGQLMKVVGGYADKKSGTAGAADSGDGSDGGSMSVSVSESGAVGSYPTTSVDAQGHLAGPCGLALTPQGTYVVTLYRGHAVVEIDPHSGFLRVLADQRTEKRLRGPAGVFYRSTSFIVASYDNKKVLIFNTSSPTRSSAVLIDSRFSSYQSSSIASRNM